LSTLDIFLSHLSTSHENFLKNKNKKSVEMKKKEFETKEMKKKTQQEEVGIFLRVE
jgi:hypothetical protein